MIQILSGLLNEEVRRRFRVARVLCTGGVRVSGRKCCVVRGRRYVVHVMNADGIGLFRARWPLVRRERQSTISGGHDRGGWQRWW